MADNNSSENFALGLIVAALVYLIFRKQIDNFAARNGLSGSRGGNGASSSANGGNGGCGCSSPCGAERKTAQELPTNPGISLGGESYSTNSFSSSSVTP